MRKFIPHRSLGLFCIGGAYFPGTRALLPARRREKAVDFSAQALYNREYHGRGSRRQAAARMGRNNRER